MDRDAHLQWCKDRALAYLPGDPVGAITSMISDLDKHSDTTDHPAKTLAVMLFMNGNLNTAHECRTFIEGFN